MTLTPDNDLNEISRQRTRDQFGLLKKAHRERILVDTDDPADFNFICSSEHVLVAPLDPNGSDEDDAVNRLSAYLTDTRGGEFEPVPDQPEQTRTGLSRRFELPARTVPAPDGKDLLATLDEIDRDLGVGFATPDHLVHICVKGSICPASEPTETGFPGPWPQDTSDPGHGDGVRVVVIDTGWHDPTTLLVNPEPALPWSWLANVSGDPEPNGIVDPQSGNLRAYAGHGTFVAGVVRAMAPKAEVTVLNLAIDRQEPGGGVLESQLVDDLYDALEPDQMEQLPHLINMSAGCPTRLGLQAQSFVHWRADLEQRHPDPDLVLVAAAGNNSSPWELLARVLRLGDGRGVAGQRRSRVGLLQLGRLRRRVRPGSQRGERLPQRHLRLPRVPGPRGQADLRQLAGSVERDLVLGTAGHRADRGRDEPPTGAAERARRPGRGARRHSDEASSESRAVGPRAGPLDALVPP